MLVNQPRRFKLSIDTGEAVGSLKSPLYLDKKEAGQILGLSAKTIERLIQRGKLPAYKPAGKVRISEGDLMEYLESTRIEPSIHDI